MTILASLIFCPAAGRSSAGSLPSAFSCSVSKPFLPSRRTRTSSRSGRVRDASTSASACSMRRPRPSAMHQPSKSSRSTASMHAADLDPLPVSSGRGTGFGFFCDGGKSRHVMHGEVREYLAVDRQFRLVQAVDQRAVAHAAQTRRGVDAGDPQRAEFALFLATPAIGVLTRLDDRLLRRAEDLAPGVVVALRLLENFLVTASSDDASFNSCHVVSPRSGVRKQLLDPIHIGLIYVHLATQLALTL